MIGMSFEGCGVGESVPINALVGNFFGDAENGFFDRLMIWDPTEGYRYYFFVDGTDEPTLDKKWFWDDIRSDGEPIKDSHIIAAGEATWYVRFSLSSATAVTVPGQVRTTDFTIPIGTAYTMVGNPFPVDIAINNLQGDFYGDAENGFFDRLMIWDFVEGYRYYFFVDGTDVPELDKKWFWDDIRSDGEPISDSHIIAPGEAFWFVRYGSHTKSLTVPAPVID